MSEFSEYWAKLKKICRAHPKGKPLDEQGRFYPDPTPVAPPVNFGADIDMFERMRNIVRHEMSIHAQNQGFESFEEADDFEVDDEYEPFSEYELIVEQARPDAPVVNPDPDQPTAAPPGGPPAPPADGPGTSSAPAGSPSGAPPAKQA